MGPTGRDAELLPDDGAGWWWQVLSGLSQVPVLGSGRADDMLSARIVTETVMNGCEGSLLGMTVGPGGRLDRCRRTVGGSLRWLRETEG